MKTIFFLASAFIGLSCLNSLKRTLRNCTFMGWPAWICKAMMPSLRAMVSSSTTSHIRWPLIFSMMRFPRAVMSYSFQSRCLMNLASSAASPKRSTTLGLWSLPITVFSPRPARLPRKFSP